MLRAALERWIQEDTEFGDGPELSYKLDYQYTEANCRMNDLKAAGKARVEAVLLFPEDLRFTTYLASLEREVSDGCEDDGYDPYDRYGGYGYWDLENGDKDKDEDEDEDEGYYVSSTRISFIYRRM